MRHILILGHEDNFVKYGEKDIDTLQTFYEYESVMHYDAYAFSANGLPTIVPRKNSTATLGQRVGMSSIDVLEVQRYYGCLPTPSGCNRMTLGSIIFSFLLPIISILRYEEINDKQKDIYN